MNHVPLFEAPVTNSLALCGTEILRHISVHNFPLQLQRYLRSRFLYKNIETEL